MYIRMVCAPSATAIPLYVWDPEPKMTLSGMLIPCTYPSMLITFDEANNTFIRTASSQ